MRYFFDFDRTVFDTESFKRSIAARPSLRALFYQLKEPIAETFNSSRTLPKRRIFTRTLGTYASHGRFGLAPQDVKDFMYPDAVEFFKAHGKDCTIVTYGVRAFITAKVTSALSDFTLNDVVYTHRKKGKTIKRLCEGQEGPFIFVDDAHFQLESVGRVCPNVKLYEMRRDGHAGDGRWPVIHSLDELPLPRIPMASIDFSKAKVAAILNIASGSCDSTAGPKVEAMLAEAGVTDPKIWCIDADSIEASFKEAHAYEPDVLIVLGGDGTIRTGAEACTSTGPYLIALPGGTMNMLPKALYGTRSWEDALRDTLAAPQVKSVSGGTVGGRQFFIAAIAGAPTLWTHAREALRAGDMGGAVDKGIHAFQNMLSIKIKYSFTEGQDGEADAITIICPLISDAMADSERSLEAAAIEVNDAAGVLGLASSAAFGAWRDDGHVTIVKTQTVSIAADEEIPLILDGEAMDLGKNLVIRFVPEAFKALVPGEKDLEK